MVRIRPGVALGTVTEEWDEELPALLARAGVATVEISPALFADGTNPHTVRTSLAAHGVAISSVHAPFGTDLDPASLDPTSAARGIEAAGATVSLASRLAAPLVVLHASYEPINPEQRAQHLEQAARSLDVLGQQAAKLGVRIAVEWLPRTCLGNCLEELRWLVAAMPAGVGGVCLDTNHVMGAHTELPQLIAALGPQLIALHLSDYDGIDERHWPPGQGVVDWPACLAALDDIVYQGPWTFECQLAGEGSKARLETLQQVVRGLLR